jgi:hypothetical protein
MKRLLFLGLALAVSTPSLAPADPCSDGCSRHFRQQLSICSSTYAGDSEAIYLCSQEAQAEYDSCLSNCQ